MDDSTEKNTLEQYFYQANFSPTPIPRKKILLDPKLHSFMDDESLDFESNSNIVSCANLKTKVKINSNQSDTDKLDQSLCRTEIINFSSSENFFNNSSLITSTMPLPRKPRKNQSFESKQPTSDSDKSSLNQYEEATQDTANYCFINTKKYLNPTSNSSTQLLLDEIQEVSSQTATLKIERYKLKRPTAPPPPPPPNKSQHSFLLEFSTNPYLLTYTANTTKSTTSYLNSTNVSSLISTPHLSSTKIPDSNPSTPVKTLACNLEKKNFIGFKPLEKKSNFKSKFLKYLKLKLESQEKNFLYDFLVFICAFLLFFICILSISLFQTKVNDFYRIFLNKNLTFVNQTNTSAENELEYYTAGSNLVKQTILMCNGPYFSYQINNLIVLPFSLILAIVFSFFSKRDSCAVSCSRRPGIPSNLNPFQRRNRFLVAALFCILANEIFKMIESSMFDVSTKESYNSTTELLNSILDINVNKSKYKSHSNKDLLKIGLGLEPNIAQLQTKLVKTTKKNTPKTTKPFFLIAPSVLAYSKPKLRPRLNLNDFQTTATSKNLYNIESNKVDGKINDIKLNINIAQANEILKQSKNKTMDILSSLNQTLNASSNQTLFELSMSIYQNKYVQGVFRRIFESRELKWTILVEKLEKVVIMLVEVLIIGMRYYPLMGVLDKNSLVCILLGSIYMWTDIFYNVAITGLCEGLKLNVSFDLLKDVRRVFGVGFIFDAKENFKLNSPTKIIRNGQSREDVEQMPIDARLLFSTNRIVYTIVKCLPHFFCLSYVTVRLTASFVRRFYAKIKYSQKPKSIKAQNEYDYEYFNQNYIVNTNKTYDLIYKKVIPSKKAIKSLSFESRYVKNVLENKNCQKDYTKFWSFDKNFRFSTRIVCTYTVCFTVLYYLTCFLIFYGSIFIDMIYLPNIYKNSIVLSTFITSGICLVQLLLSMKQFKLHLNSLYKGQSQQYIGSREIFSNKKIATSSFNYAGYAVTYTCWGYIILFFLLTFVSFQIATLITFGSTTLGLFILILLCPFLVSMLIIKLINRFISSFAAKYCFLQKRSKILAVKNFKLYSLFLYFKFFYDCFTGMAFCLMRMLKSILLSIIFLPRLDYSFMGRCLEKMDSPFMSYVGYLHWEAHHTNPIMISFCELLYRTVRKKKIKRKFEEKSFLRARNKWQLIYTLYKNPEFVKLRKNFN